MTEESPDPDLMADEWFIRNLRARRLEAGMSQRQMGERMREIGFPFEQQTIQRIESGGRKASFGEAKALARILRIDAMALTEPPRLTENRATLWRVGKAVSEHRAQADFVDAAYRAAAAELARQIEQAKAGDLAAELADDIAAAERILKGEKP